MPRYIDTEKIDFRLPYFEDENGDALVSLRAVKQCIDATPSEDVVPREELDAMRGAANSYKMHYENARAEVAREIFKEIEKVLKANFIDCAEDCSFTYYDLCLKRDLVELKKKYTKGKDTNVTAAKDFFTPEEVRKMSPQEVRQNYQAIMKSMKKW